MPGELSFWLLWYFLANHWTYLGSPSIHLQEGLIDLGLSEGDAHLREIGIGHLFELGRPFLHLQGLESVGKFGSRHEIGVRSH